MHKISLQAFWEIQEDIFGGISPQQKGYFCKGLDTGDRRNGRYLSRDTALIVADRVRTYAGHKSPALLVQRLMAKKGWTRRMNTEQKAAFLDALLFFSGVSEPAGLISFWAQAWGVKSLDQPINRGQCSAMLALAIDYGLITRRVRREMVSAELFARAKDLGSRVSKRQWNYWADRLTTEKCIAIAWKLSIFTDIERISTKRAELFYSEFLSELVRSA